MQGSAAPNPLFSLPYCLFPTLSLTEEEPMQNTIPMLSYENAKAAVAWLSRAFGFELASQIEDEAGIVIHAEMKAGLGIVFLAQGPDGYMSPATLEANFGANEAARRTPWVINGVLVYVSELAKVHALALSGGARLLGEVEEGYPGRRFRAEDLEGQRWMFMERPSDHPL